MTSDHGRGRAHGHGQALQRTVAAAVAQEDKGSHSRHSPPLGTPVGTPEKLNLQFVNHILKVP